MPKKISIPKDSGTIGERLSALLEKCQPGEGYDIKELAKEWGENYGSVVKAAREKGCLIVNRAAKTSYAGIK